MTVTNSADNYPEGEIIWNSTDALYDLSPTTNYLASANATHPTITDDENITNFLHTDAYNVNMYNSSALGEYYTAPASSAAGNINLTWSMPSAAAAVQSDYGPADITNPGIEYLFKQTIFSPVVNDDNSMSSYKCTIKDSLGKYKFNKLALYAVKRDADYIRT